MEFDYKAIQRQVENDLGEDFRKDPIPLIKVLSHAHSKLVAANFQYASTIMLRNDVSILIEPSEYPIVSNYNTHEQEYIKAVFCTCLNRPALNNKNKMK